MNNKTLKKILPILLLAAAFFLFLTFKSGSPQEPENIPDIVEVTPTPSAEATPEITETPEISAEPVQTAEPTPEATPEPTAEPAQADNSITEDTQCDDKDCVAYYVYTYGHLPSNYMSKKEARKRGWNSGALSKVLKGMAIGGDRFGNMEGYLPEEYNYIECDIDTIGKKSRGAKRIVFADGGVLVYYTEDHYETFELLYGEE